MFQTSLNKIAIGSLLSITLVAQAMTVQAATQGVNPSQNSHPPTPKVNIVSKTAPIFYGSQGAYPFSKAVRAGDTLYLSGELGMKDNKLVSGGIKAQTAQALDNINQTLLSYGYQSSDLVKCMVMLTDIKDFDAFNDVYQSKLSKPYPVRSAFAVKDLALGAKVEIECMAVK
ncbi:RidA family protein [Psychrobacter raelei]|uniref:Endoribonuclease L-PSP n=1 Tax=Psychrobacter sp. (strain PRwf-1) TaxID=349106 RepID=A5WDZ6_PSYWF